LAIKAKELWLIPYGISFHVWSQQNDIHAWDSALTKAKELFDKLSLAWIKLGMINLGWWLPTTYIKKTEPLENYMNKIRSYISAYFDENEIELIYEPGRSIVWDIGVIVSEITLVSKKSLLEDEIRWVYLDIGMFWWLIETLDEAIKYPIYTEIEWEKSWVILAWPTCDSADILYEKYLYQLPNALKSWDMVYIFSTWAYTQSYSAIEFNWFPPLQTYVI
jgi:ornithine decarboxylase